MSAVEQTRTVLSALHKYIASVHPRKCQQGKIQAGKDKQRQPNGNKRVRIQIQEGIAQKCRKVSLKSSKVRAQKYF